MSVWKVLTIGVLSCICLALAMGTVIITLDQEGGQRWLWLGSLLAATLCASGVLVLFLRYAGRSLDVKPRWSER